jgi:hypothetical protein
MAVIIQEVVGNRFGTTFYPHASGTAQSHNYYPVSHMVPEDGFAVLAVGLGHYVAEGEKSFRFSPAYPSIDIISQDDLRKNSQTFFYAVDMDKRKINLLDGETAGLIKLDISEAERHSTLKHSASVYNPDNDSISTGLDTQGPRVINFANILKYNYIPIASTIATILDVVREAFGTSVEIEFAVDFTKDRSGFASFYLLQVKPMVGSGASYSIDRESIDPERLLLLSSKSMGNGIIDDISDIIYIEPAGFDNLLTEKMADEIDNLNQKMLRENRKYILIGPGRWGTHDKFIGVPVAWPQISNARVIVEVGLPDFHVDASLGSHFFHNVTSMNVGYFSVHDGSDGEIIRWDLFRNQEVVEKGEFFVHIRFPQPLQIMMDGKKQIAAIFYDS